MRHTVLPHTPGDAHCKVGRYCRTSNLRGNCEGPQYSKAWSTESFRVLIKELQSLGLDVRVLDKYMKEVELRDDDEDDSCKGRK